MIHPDKLRLFREAGISERLLKGLDDGGNLPAMDRLKLYDFWAEWCAPCKAMMPTVEALSEKFKDKVELVKVNIDEQPELADMYNVRAVPTLVLMGDQEMMRVVGGLSATKLELKLMAALADGDKTTV